MEAGKKSDVKMGLAFDLYVLTEVFYHFFLNPQTLVYICLHVQKHGMHSPSPKFSDLQIICVDATLEMSII